MPKNPDAHSNNQRGAENSSIEESIKSINVELKENKEVNNCYFCQQECNPNSQSCGRCSRELTSWFWKN